MSIVGQRKTKEEVKDALKDIASEMHNKMEKGVPPSMTLPVRSKTNIGFDNKLGVYKYGKKRALGMRQALARQDNSCVHCM